MIFSQIPAVFTPLGTSRLFEQFWGQNGTIELIIPDVKRRSVGMFQTLFGVNMSIFKGAMAPGSEVTFFFGTLLRFYSEFNNPIKEIFNFS